MYPDDRLTQDLRKLHETYIDLVNRAIEEGREDLAYELADCYTEESLRLMLAR